MRKPEILAPVGNRAMLEAALAAGADSFYMALDDFGARAYAENFDIENIKEVIDYIHLFGKRVFITINTLIKDEEMKKALYYIEKLYEYGADGILLQDIGLFSLIRDRVPGLEIHASTQMAVRDYYGAKALMDLGFKRVVIARETPFEEIEKITKLDVETEVFVHGSLCVSFSGECLMSSFIGKRSANRGRCAGACRKKYQLISDGKVLGEDYYLNMNDLNTIDQVDKLVEAGVDCIKIEGRMKSPEYVYTVVKNYWDKIDSNHYLQEDLQDISIRAYTEGFIFGQKRDYITLENTKKRRALGEVFEKNGEKYFFANSKALKGTNLEVTTDRDKRLPLTLTSDLKKGEKFILEKYPDAKVGSEILILNSNKLTKDLQSGLETYKNIPVEIEFRAKVGEKAQIKIKGRGKKATYTGQNILEKAKKISIKKEEIEENLSRFKDQIFTPTSIKIDMDPDVFIRKKEINEARREVLKNLEREILKDYHREKIKIDLPILENNKNRKREKNLELLTKNIDLEKLKDYDNIYIREYDEKYKGLSLYYVLDSHMEYKIDELIKFLKEKSIKGVVFNNYRDLAFVDDFKKNNIKIRIGRYLNIFNLYAYDFYKNIGEMITGSVESTFSTINEAGEKYPAEILAYGPIELMNMVHCPFSVVKKCGLVGCKTCKFNHGKLKDMEGNVFEMIRYDEAYSKIYSTRYANIDQNKLSDNISLLALVSKDSDLENFEKKTSIDNLNYERGVL